MADRVSDDLGYVNGERSRLFVTPDMAASAAKDAALGRLWTTPLGCISVADRTVVTRTAQYQGFVTVALAGALAGC